MRCSDELIIRRLDGELSPEGEEELEIHLKGCAACRKKASDLVASAGILRKGLLKDSDPPETIWRAVMEKTRVGYARLRFYRAAAAAAAAALIISGVFLSRSPGEGYLSGFSSLVFESVSEEEWGPDGALEGDTVIDMFLRGEL